MLDLRTRLRDLVVRLVPESTRRAVRIKRRRPPEPGLPPGLDRDLLDEVCHQQRGSAPTQTAYRQISGWRKPTSGAFRVFLTMESGDRWSIVFKNAVLSAAETPGIKGLPAAPGVAEYLVYQASEVLGEHLPTPYAIREIEPRRHYTYILEDLVEAGYRSAFPEADVVWAAGRLPIVQTKLTAALAPAREELVHYDARFAEELQELAHDNFRRFALTVPDSAIEEVLKEWSRISEFHSRIPSHIGAVALHGDPNRANTLVPEEHSRSLRLVDWEWAGWGLPHADLASLLKGRPEKVTERGIAAFARSYPDVSLDEHARIHAWARVDTRLFDASYMINQLLASPDTSRMNLPRYVHVCARDIVTTVRQERP